MKITLTVELDLSNAPAYNVATAKDLPLSLQNLGSWLHELHLTYLEKVCEAHTQQDPLMKAALVAHAEADAGLSKQLFDNYKVSGTTDDGHRFEFTHKEPGYQETTIIDGQKVRPE